MKKKIGNYVIHEDGKVFSYYINDYLKPDVTREGYEQVTLYINGERKREKVHRLVASAFIPNPEQKPTVNHIDGDKRNNHYSNLEWATHYENNKHARENGLNPVSKSNSERWKNEDFRKATSEAISKGKIESGSARGRKNPNFRYLLLQNEKEISRQELSEITGYAMSTTDRKIREHSQGKLCERFLENNIHIIDTKEDVQTNERVD